MWKLLQNYCILRDNFPVFASNGVGKKKNQHKAINNAKFHIST